MIENLELWVAYPCIYEPGTHFKTHVHDYHELIVIQHGQYHARVSNKERIAKIGDVLFYSAGKVHEEWVENDAPVILWTCGFRGVGLRHDEPVFRRDIHNHVLENIARLHYLWNMNEIYNGYESYFAPLLQRVVEELDTLPCWDSYTMIDRVRDYVRPRLTEQFTVDALAEVAGLSKSHFVRQYREQSGRTPMEDIRYLRVEEASRLIATTPLPLHEIAPLVGIVNVYHLSRLLKTVLGVGVRDLRHAGIIDIRREQPAEPAPEIPSARRSIKRGIKSSE